MSVNAVVVVSDLHVGCQLALCHPDGARLDDGGTYSPSPVQHKLWAWWEDFWNRAVPAMTHGQPYAVVVNGDAIDGVHHGSTNQWSHNLGDQCRHAEQILKPIVERCEGRYYHIRGTEAHVGKSATEEERLARELDAIPNADGQYARYELWLEIGRGLAHITHHIGTAGSMAYESSAVMREMSEAYVEAGRWANRPPDWVCRSHRHRSCEVRLPTHNSLATGFTTPAWQLKTPFAYRIAGARQSLPQIGGCVMVCGDVDLYTRHQVYELARPTAEVA